jgi:hypothetical protein
MAPRPSPKIYLPDRFTSDTTELEDGTVVELNTPDIDSLLESKNADIIVEVRPSTEDGNAGRKPLLGAGNDMAARKEKIGNMDEMEDGKPISRAERRRRIKAEIQRLSQGDEPVYYQRRLW